MLLLPQPLLLPIDCPDTQVARCSQAHAALGEWAVAWRVQAQGTQMRGLGPKASLLPFYFPMYLLKFKLSTSILPLNSLSICITSVLNSDSLSHFIWLFFWSFVWFFIWGMFLCLLILAASLCLFLCIR